MKFLDWFRPGINIKRWIFLGIGGVFCISYGLSFIVNKIYLSNIELMFSLFLMIAGIIFIFLSVKYILKTFYNLLSSSGFRVTLDSERLSSLIYEKRILIKGPKIVAVGGGTGISTILRGLKAYSSNITAVVTVADDGGGSGVLRQDLGMLPPGDIRNCILALADTEPILENLLQYRFQDGMLKGQSFGNLFLAAMDGISSNFGEAVKKMSEVLAVTGRVLPVTLQNVKLNAELEDGCEIIGETAIGEHNKYHKGKIKRVYLEPAEAKPLIEVIDAIKEADVILFGPGSLYTSIIPNLLVNGVSEALKVSKAIKIYICNVMTQPGETDNYKLSDHIKSIENHSFEGLLDYCITNNASISDDLKFKYKNDGAFQVENDIESVSNMGIKIVEGNFVSINNNYIRHNAEKLSEAIINLIAEKILINDKKRSLDYFYLSDRLKKITQQK